VIDTAHTPLLGGPVLAAAGPMSPDELADKLFPLFEHGWSTNGHPLTILDLRASISGMSAQLRGLDQIGGDWRTWQPGTAAHCLLPHATGTTQIWTPDGEKRVEDLRINDLVVTSSGEAKPIQWVWAQCFERQGGQKWDEGIAPIRVVRSALGPNTPHRDLFLSRYHCLYLDGVLIPVVDLLNNSTITRCSAEDLREIEYFHIKLERHSVIYAEGAACETLRDITAVKSEFEEYRKLYGGVSLPDEPAAPIFAYNGGRSRLRGRIRRVISLVIDVRSKLEIVRDDLKKRAAAFSLTAVDER
jgi:hypothetical protein